MRASDKVAFLHDADASQDERMMEVISIHGNRGVGFFWRLVERMRAATDYRLDMRLLSGISHSLSESLADAKQMLETFETVGLFAREDEHFLFSPSLRRRMEAYDSKRSKCIEAGKKGGVAKASRSERLADAKQSLSAPLAYKTKLNTIEPNTTEPNGSVLGLDPSTSLDGTDLGTNPVPDPSKPTPRKVLTRKPEPVMPALPPHLDTPEVRAALDEWIAYKRERGQTYKQLGLNSVHRTLLELGAVRFIAAVKHSTGSNYAGLVEGSRGGAPKQTNLDRAKEIMRQTMMEAE